MIKGTMLHMAAKVIFVFSSYLIHFFLGKYLTPVNYGIVGTILTIINLDYLFVNNGVRQAVSKTLAEGKYSTYDVIKKGFIAQGIVVLVIFFSNFSGAGIICHFLNDNSLVEYIKFAAFIIPFTGTYFLIMGILNGSKNIIPEAIIVCVYPILKLSVIPFTLFLFSNPINGVIMGYLFAGFIICIFSVIQEKYPSFH